MSNFELIGEPSSSSSEDSSMAGMLKLLGLKDVPLPTQIPKDDAEFPELKHDFEHSMVIGGIQKYVEGTCKIDHEPQFEEMTAHFFLKTQLLYATLDGCCKKARKAAAVIRSVHDRNGFIAWRRLTAA